MSHSASCGTHSGSDHVACKARLTRRRRPWAQCILSGLGEFVPGIGGDLGRNAIQPLRDPLHVRSAHTCCTWPDDKDGVVEVQYLDMCVFLLRRPFAM